MQCRCAGGFCSVQLVWDLLGSRDESGYNVHLSASPVITASTMLHSNTILKYMYHPDLALFSVVCSVLPWTEDLWRALQHVNLLFFLMFFCWLRRGLNPRPSGVLPLTYSLHTVPKYALLIKVLSGLGKRLFFICFLFNIEYETSLINSTFTSTFTFWGVTVLKGEGICTMVYEIICLF